MPRGSVPTVSELEARIDEAVVIARASEEGVREVGEVALDAARQARRAAEAAEASAAAARDAAQASAAGPAGPASAPGPAGPDPDLAPPPAAGAAGAASSGWSPKSAPPPGSSVELEAPAPEQGSSSEEELAPGPPVHFEARFRRFSERADRVSARLRALQDHPRHPAVPSAGAMRRRGDG